MRLEEFDVDRLKETVRYVLYNCLNPEVRDRVEFIATQDVLVLATMETIPAVYWRSATCIAIF